MTLYMSFGFFKIIWYYLIQEVNSTFAKCQNYIWSIQKNLCPFLQLLKICFCKISLQEGELLMKYILKLNLQYRCALIKIKFRHYEKATKFEKIFHLFWHNSCFYSVTSKQVGDFFKFSWPFQKSWTLSCRKKNTHRVPLWNTTEHFWRDFSSHSRYSILKRNRTKAIRNYFVNLPVAMHKWGLSNS